MSQQPSVEDLLKRNSERVKTFEPIPRFEDISQLPPDKAIPMPKIFIVSCCDPRIDPWDILGLSQWDAVVTRGAAGRVAHQLNNLLFLDHILQFTDVMIIHHTDCSAASLTNEEVREVLKQRVPGASYAAETVTLPGFTDPESSIREDIQLVRESPLVRRDLAARTRGFVYDITSGEVKPVAE